MKKYVGTKTVKAVPMTELAARTRTTTSGVKAIMCSTPTLTVASTTLGHLSPSLRRLIELLRLLLTVLRLSLKN